jgi:molybdopterin-guanine dinucleotide biosynthesis protein A
LKEQVLLNRGAIILCGGKSTRMGRDKASLPFGDEQMLQRVSRQVSQVIEPANIVCVAADGQQLPALASEIRVVRDRCVGRGPLEGLAAGIAALKNSAEAVYATSCDVPLLHPAWIDRLFELLGDHDVVVPREGRFHHPLAAVYRSSVLPRIEELLVADQLRPVFLFERCKTHEIPVETLRDVDPQLQSLLNCNHPEDYQAALAAVGLGPEPAGH